MAADSPAPTSVADQRPGDAAAAAGSAVQEKAVKKEDAEDKNMAFSTAYCYDNGVRLPPSFAGHLAV
jgi:hypothetical protein